MTINSILILVLALFVVVALLLSIRVVPAEHAAIIERLGKYQRTAPAGLVFVIPSVDRLRTPFVGLGEQALQSERSLSTADGHLVSVPTTIHLRVVNPQAATYQVADYRAAVDLLTTTTLRNLVAELPLDDLLGSRGQLTKQLQVALSATDAWGLRVERVEIGDFQRPRTGPVE